MKTDIEIAQEAVMEPIKNVAARCGISEDDLELYGKYKAKISDEYINSVKDNECLCHKIDSLLTVYFRHSSVLLSPVA